MVYAKYPVPMRATPTYSQSHTTGIQAYGAGQFNVSSAGTSNIGKNGTMISVFGTSGTNAGCFRVYLDGNGYWYAVDAEL
jgi:hypothetical protein